MVWVAEVEVVVWEGSGKGGVVFDLGVDPVYSKGWIGLGVGLGK